MWTVIISLSWSNFLKGRLNEARVCLPCALHPHSDPDLICWTVIRQGAVSCPITNMPKKIYSLSLSLSQSVMNVCQNPCWSSVLTEKRIFKSPFNAKAFAKTCKPINFPFPFPFSFPFPFPFLQSLDPEHVIQWKLKSCKSVMKSWLIAQQPSYRRGDKFQMAFARPNLWRGKVEMIKNMIIPELLSP